MKTLITREDYARRVDELGKNTKQNNFLSFGVLVLLILPLAIASLFLPDDIFDSGIAKLVILLWLFVGGIPSVLGIVYLSRKAYERSGLLCPKCSNPIGLINVEKTRCCGKCGETILEE
jgi:ribosomal protein S27AE